MLHIQATQNKAVAGGKCKIYSCNFTNWMAASHMPGQYFVHLHLVNAQGVLYYIFTSITEAMFSGQLKLYSKKIHGRSVHCTHTCTQLF